MSGRERWSYWCPDCKWSKEEEGGVAMWKAISDAKEAAEKKPNKKEGEGGA